jgi:putative ABC transport system permease protein
MTVRERLREVAILKAVGYPRDAVLFMVVAEAVLISMMGVALGIGVGELLRFADLEGATEGFITQYSPALLTYALAVGTGLFIGLVSGFIPAWQAANMTVMGAMRGLD